MSQVDELVWLCRELGQPTSDLAILAEGNASARSGNGFWVKASGFELGSLSADGLVEIDLAKTVAFLDGPELTDAETRLALSESTLGSKGKLPSVETFVHAYLLNLTGIEFVGHTHPTSLLSLLCLPRAQEFATHRLFPDEIVCCGPESAFVPYVDPGLSLARAIRTSVDEFAQRRGELPRTIWLQNHGLIALGSTAREVLAAHRMSQKSARVLLGALSTGMEPRRLSKSEVERIHTRPDEHYRQKLLRELTNA
jgi:L-ribulose-5-phosphate 4-epimerase